MKEKGEDRSSRIRWYLALRTVIVTFILALTILTHARGGGLFLPSQLTALYALAGLSFVGTFFHALLYRKLIVSATAGYLVLAGDNVLISLMVVASGGVDSIFAVLYFFVFIAAAMIFYRTGGFFISIQGGLFYLVAVFSPLVSHHWPWLDLEGRYYYLSASYLLYRATLTVTAFVVVTYLAGYLSESLRRTGDLLEARESDLAELKSLYENIIQSISTGLITAGLGGRIISINRAGEKITRTPSARCVGRDFHEVFLLPGERDPFRTPPGELELGLRCEAGLRFMPGVVLGMTFSTLWDDKGVVSGIICSFQDVTQIRRLEEQIKRSDRLAAIGEMAAGVAHEIRNPLASISGSIQVLREDLPLTVHTRRLMDIVTGETERLNRIINDFLLFANPRPARIESVAVGPVLEEIRALLESSLPERDRYRIVVGGEGIDRVLEADPHMLRQAFWNVSLNAVQAMPGGGTLEVGVRHETENAGGEAREFLVVSFADTGCGIPPENLRRLFTPFFSTKESGTGLGLSIVYKIVEQHGGAIEIENRETGGTVFRLRFPLQAAGAPVTGRVKHG